MTAHNGERVHVDNRRRVRCPECGGAGKIAGTVDGVPASVCTKLTPCYRCWPRDENGDRLFWDDGTAGTLAPWPPSARHHHGFLRTVTFSPDTAPAPYAEPWIVSYVDGQRMVGDRDLVALDRQRRDEWKEFYAARQDDLKGHPCLPPWGCLFTAMAEVLALAVDERVDTSPVTGLSGRSAQ